MNQSSRISSYIWIGLLLTLVFIPAVAQAEMIYCTGGYYCNPYIDQAGQSYCLGGTVSQDCPYGGGCLSNNVNVFCTDDPGGGWCGWEEEVVCNNAPDTGQCSANSDCNDSSSCTDDVCNNAGQPSSTCSNTSNGSCSVTCSADADCNDSNSCTTDVCNNAGTTSSSCSNTDNGSCSIACSANSDCNDSSSCTDDVCNNAGTTSSSCSNTSNGSCNLPTSGSISVSTNNAGASWSIPGAGSGSGTSVTYTGLSFGTYTISLGALAGYTCTPDAWSKGIDSGTPDATFYVTCTANPALSGTVTAISSPRNSVLTSSGQPSGTISGTVSGGSGSGYQVQVVVSRGPSGCDYWLGASWGCGVVPTTYVTVSGNTWSINSAGVPPIGQMTDGQVYRVWVNVGDSSGAWSYWNISSPLILFETGAPSGTITAIENPATNRLTSNGSPLGTIAGTATDTLSNVTSIQVVIRERNPGGVDGVCDAFDRDWNGSTWVAECTAPAIFLPFTPALDVNWSYSNTPPTNQMTDGLTYIVYLNIIDAAGNSSVWNPRTSILYSPNSPPVAESVTATEPDYCTTGPSVTISWTYTDPDDPPPATTQSAYRVQIDDNAGFGSINFDSGKLLSSSDGYVGSGLAWDTTYYSRVMVWDDTDTPSEWANQSVCVGSGCIGQTSWRTPQHAYPSNVNTFSWTPVTPPIGQEVTFSDGSTVCYSAGGIPVACSSWLWSFGDSGSSTAPAPTHTYTLPGSYSVDLTVTDAQGYACLVTKNLRVQQNIPGWKEVLPK